MKFHIKKQDVDSELHGVKSALKKSNGLNNLLGNLLQSRDEYVLKMLIENNLHSKILSYYIDNKILYKFYKKTYIGEYTSKKGYTSKAHFHPVSHKYLGSVRKLGTSPINWKSYEIPDILKHKWCVKTNTIVSN
jgi:hypothetical protein